MRTIKTNIITVLVGALLVSGISTSNTQAKSSNTIKFKQKAVTLSVGESEKIHLLDNSKKVNRILTYKSKDLQVAKVTPKGKVIGVGAGKTKIAVKLKLKNGRKKNIQCTVTVVEGKKKTDKSIIMPVVTNPVEPSETVMPTTTDSTVPFATAMPASIPGIIATIAPDAGESTTPTERPNLSNSFKCESVSCSDIEVDIKGTKIITHVKCFNQITPSIGDFTIKISSYDEWLDFWASSKDEPIMASQVEQSKAVLDAYDQSFFENNVLLIGGYDFGRGYEFEVRSCSVDVQGKLSCDMMMEKVVSADQVLTCDVVTYFTIIELDKENAEKITEMEFDYKQWIPL